MLAVLVVLVTHFLLGPYSAGQRDFLMSIPALAAALASAKSAEDHEHGRFYLMLVGAFAMAAASINSPSYLADLPKTSASVIQPSRHCHPWSLAISSLLLRKLCKPGYHRHSASIA
jgi:hypothetical protein